MFIRIKGIYGLRYPLLIDCVLIQQVYDGRLSRIKVPPPTNALGSFAPVTKGVPDDAHLQVKDADALRELGHADQLLNLPVLNSSRSPSSLCSWSSSVRARW
jgi:hypothetical protein